jgi:hypothetical protein
MVEKVRALGPLGIPEKFEEWDKEMNELEAHVTTGEEVAHA